ncbi:alpha/beta fold hydrolase [Nocardia sp. alder85J]|uniref:alpha/beta fold hydrolase n=1 Tax=Nocardia sp. alder85J TaxID=2862949 RepID=UPI002255A2F3|nr:alpha/beta hydrolase [Nocardia sp. alder85J]MCX4095660.1 alpha/beta hydrolase [Nocardia sp. alder85J]
MRYFDSGPAKSDLPPVVLVHGTGGTTSSHYSFVFPMLAAHQRVISVDLADTRHEVLALSDLEAQVAAVIRDAVTVPVTLVGYSLGAVVASSLAGRHGAPVDRLVTIAGWMRTDAQQRLRNDIWRELRDSGSESARKFTVFAGFGGDFLGERKSGELEALINSVEFTQFQYRQMDLNRRIDITESVRNIRAKALVIGCRDDYMVPARHSRMLFGAMPDARYTEITSGHAVVFERPAELVHWIGAFNADTERYPAGAILSAAQP